MPNRPVHDFLTVASSVVIAPITYSIIYSTGEVRDWAPIVAAVLFVTHNISGILFSPDLDMDTHIHKRWGIFYVLWIPYQMIIPHRHFWSHGLVLPPLLRMGYFFWMVVLCVFVIERIAAYFGIQVPSMHTTITRSVLELVAAHPVYAITTAVGFVTGAAVHSIADWIVSGGKSVLRTLFVPPSQRAQKKAMGQRTAPSHWLFNPFSSDMPRHF